MNRFVWWLKFIKHIQYFQKPILHFSDIILIRLTIWRKLILKLLNKLDDQKQSAQLNKLIIIDYI